MLDNLDINDIRGNKIKVGDEIVVPNAAGNILLIRRVSDLLPDTKINICLVGGGKIQSSRVVTLDY